MTWSRVKGHPHWCRSPEEGDALGSLGDGPSAWHTTAAVGVAVLPPLGVVLPVGPSDLDAPVGGPGLIGGNLILGSDSPLPETDVFLSSLELLESGPPGALRT